MSTNTRISEPASEKTPRRGRGRPPAFGPDYLRSLGALFPNVKTRRGLQNKAYQTRAIALMMDKPAYAKIVPPTAAVMNDAVPFWSFDLLVELGRIPDDDFLLAVALLICQTPGISLASALATARHNLTRYTVAPWGKGKR